MKLKKVDGVFLVGLRYLGLVKFATLDEAFSFMSKQRLAW